MATRTAQGGIAAVVGPVSGNNNSDVFDRGALCRPALLQLDIAAGAGPVLTVNIQGSLDGVNWFNVPYATTAVPGTAAVAAITTLNATAVTLLHLLQFGWQFLRIALSNNTNCTLNAASLLA